MLKCRRSHAEVTLLLTTYRILNFGYFSYGGYRKYLNSTISGGNWESNPVSIVPNTIAEPFSDEVTKFVTTVSREK